MAQDNDNATLKALPRRPPLESGFTESQCSRCEEKLVVHHGELKRCLCGALQLEWPRYGGLGPRPTHFPERDRKRGHRA